MSSKFPITRRLFEFWWDQQTDRDDNFTFTLPRCQTCPIARCLRAHGYPRAEVYYNSWSPSGSLTEQRDLPLWARYKIDKFDTAREE